jgi:hypothetical protein
LEIEENEKIRGTLLKTNPNRKTPALETFGNQIV